MEKFIGELNAILATLETLNIQSTNDNMSKLLGCQQHLATLRDNLQKLAEKEKHNGDSDSE